MKKVKAAEADIFWNKILELFAQPCLVNEHRDQGARATGETNSLQTLKPQSTLFVSGNASFSKLMQT